MSDQPEQKASDPRIIFARRFLAKKCFTSEIAIDETVAALHLSSSRFRHLFKKETGVSPCQYVKLVRLRHARQLLEKSSLSVKEVMAAAGMNDLSHFVRDFKSVYGFTPTEVRRLSQATALGINPEQQHPPTDSHLRQHEEIATTPTDVKLSLEPS